MTRRGQVPLVVNVRHVMSEVRTRAGLPTTVDHASPQVKSTFTTDLITPSPSITTMASRRLALNLQHAARARAAINAVKSPAIRGLATPVSHGAKTESTTLSNGFTVCHALRVPR